MGGVKMLKTKKTNSKATTAAKKAVVQEKLDVDVKMNKQDSNTVEKVDAPKVVSAKEAEVKEEKAVEAKKVEEKKTETKPKSTTKKTTTRKTAAKSTTTKKATTSKKTATKKVEEKKVEEKEENKQSLNELLGMAFVRLIPIENKTANDYPIRVALRNLDYRKVVKVRYTEDNWINFQEVSLDYKYSDECGVEEWSKSIKIDNAKIDKFQYAISYEVAGQTFWDNNFGRNYSF